MPTAYEAASLRMLRNAVNTRWPKRDTASDGWIGDAAHRQRVSDHNPDPKTGVVRARDIDKDGVHTPTVIGAALAHPATRYVIFNRRIWHRGVAFRPATYTGDNPHEGHIHVSIEHTTTAENSTAAWHPIDKLGYGGNVAGGGRGPLVRIVQAWLNGHGAALSVDGDFGAKTESAVTTFQYRASIKADGIVGPITIRKLGTVKSSW